MDIFADPKTIIFLITSFIALGGVGAVVKITWDRMNRLANGVVYQDEFKQFEKRFVEMKDSIVDLRIQQGVNHQEITDWLRKIDERCIKHLVGGTGN